MAYRLDSIDRIGEAVAGVATEQLDAAVRALEPGDGGVPAAGIHVARKSLKKTRSLVRLVRPAIGPKAYARANAELRDAGRLLSGARDADVMVATVEDLAERFAGHAPTEAFDAVRHALALRAAAVRTDERVPGDQAVAAIAGIREQVDGWRLDRLRRRTVAASLRRTYERGRLGLDAVRADPGDSEASHDWRKRVKDLWYQQRLLTPAWPAVIEPLAEEAHVLSEHLGQDHDLAVLRDHLAAGELDVAADLGAVLEIVERRRRELEGLALGLGRRVYAESPVAFEQRLRRYLRVWHGEERAPGPIPA